MFRLFYKIEYNKNEVWILSIKHKDECDKYIRKGILDDLKDFLDDVFS